MGAQILSPCAEVDVETWEFGDEILTAVGTIATGTEYGATSSSDLKTTCSGKTSQEGVCCSRGGSKGGKFITSGQKKDK